MKYQPRLTRRQFLAAGGTITGAAMLGLFPELTHAGQSDSAPVDAYTLRVGYSERELAGLKLRTRTYNASLPGPLLTTRPGHILRITLANSLPPDPPAVAPEGIDGENNPNRFNTTNMHVHGLQVVPHLFAPVGTSDPASRMIAIGSGQSLTYNFQLPEDHPPGLYWYHPHHHGSATVQVGGGMAGLILVKGAIDKVPEIAAARDELLAIQNIKVNPLAGGRWGWEPLAYQPAGQGGYYFTTQMELITANGRPVLVIDRRGKKPIATKQALPTYQLRPGEVMRLRILNGTDGIPMPIVLPGFEMYVIGQDGVNLLKPDRVGEDLKTAIRMAPGNRNEVLIRAPQTATTGTLIALPQMPMSPNLLSEAMGEMMSSPEIALASFVVSGAPVDMAIPERLPTPTREYPLIRDDEIVARRKVVFTMKNGVTSILTGVEFLIGGQLYSETRIDNTVRLGTAEEWTLANTSDGIHPFHIHVNSFEVLGMPGYPDYRRLHDTVWLAPFSELKMRTRFKTWKGKSVYHCHILPHEDAAMIANFMIA
jgi:suppressor of ftsI